METKGKATNPKNWDDLVFENRNTDYGAYTVRKSYNGNLTSGFLLSISFGGLLFIVPTIMSAFDDNIMDGDVDNVIACTFSVDTLEFIQPPVIAPPPPPPGAAHPPVTPPVEVPVVNVPPVATTDAPEDATITANADIPVSLPTVPEGVPGGVEGSTGTGPSDVIPSEHTDPNREWLVPQVAASYTGGMEAMYAFIRSKIKYPASARRMGIEGSVYVSFVIGRDGKVTKVEVIKGVHPDCDKEAARVIALLPGWNPGRQNDVPVMVRMTLPIKFALDK
jgi:periplasmic protein TonB